MAVWEQQLGIDYSLFSGLIVWSLIFVRIFVMMILVPFIGGRTISGRFRMAVSMVLSVFGYFIYGESGVANLPESNAVILALYFKEIFFGLALGVTTIMVFNAIESSGRIADNLRGSANAQIFLPALGQVSIFGLFQFWLGLSLFVYFDGHVLFLDHFYDSFRILPVTAMPKFGYGFTPFLELVIRMSADVMIFGVQLAAPVMIAIFLTDLVLGIANKMAPQIPVFEIGFMLKGYIGVVMIWVALESITSQMQVFFDGMQDNVVLMIRYFSG